MTVIAIASVAAFASCKKDYTCTCTEVVGTISNTTTHSISNATHNDAKNTCDTYQSQANSSTPGSTTCHL